MKHFQKSLTDYPGAAPGFPKGVNLKGGANLLFGQIFPNPHENVKFLPPATKLGQGYIFTGVSDSVHRGVWVAWVTWGHA